MQIPSPEAPLQPLPNQVQERVWEFVRRRIHDHEIAARAKVIKFAIRITEAGHIEVDILGTEAETAAALAAGLQAE